MRRLALCLMLLGAPLRAETLFGDQAAPEELRILGSTDTVSFAPLAQAFVGARPDILIRYDERETRDIYVRAAADCAAGTASTDLIISSAIDLQVALVNELCARTYRSAAVRALPDWANWRDEVFGLTLEPAVLVYNTRLVAPEDVPRTRYDLIDLLRRDSDRYFGRLVTYDIRSSGLGYLFAFEDAQNASTFGRLIETLARLDVALACCAAPMIDGVAEGRYLMAYNVLASYAAARAADNPDIGIVRFEDYSNAVSRAALIPRAAAHPAAAESFIDFALSPAGLAALRESHLLPGTGQTDGTATRPIPLSPVLLLGLDTQKRQDFLDLFSRSLGALDTP